MSTHANVSIATVFKASGILPRPRYCYGNQRNCNL